VGEEIESGRQQGTLGGRKIELIRMRGERGEEGGGASQSSKKRKETQGGGGGCLG